MSAARPDRVALIVAIAIAAAIFAISFGFVADADRSAPTAAAAPSTPRHEPAAHRPAAPGVALGPAAALHVRASLLARPVRRKPARRAARHVAPAPAPTESLPSTDIPAQPVNPSTPDGAAPPANPVPAPAPQPARPAPKPHPKPVAKPKPKPPDFDDTGPPTPGKGRAGGGR